MIITPEIKAKTKAVRFMHKKGLTPTYISQSTNLKLTEVYEILKLFFKDFKQPMTVFFGSKTESYWTNEDEIGTLPTYSESEMEAEINSILKTSKNT